MPLTPLEAFASDHAGHDLSFESQEFIVCRDCDETHELPEGAGVDVKTQVTIELPGGLTHYLNPHTGVIATFKPLRI